MQIKLQGSAGRFSSGKVPGAKLPHVSSQSFLETYQARFQAALQGIEASEGQEAISYAAALDITRPWLREARQAGRKIMIIGNGGSAGVASHLAIDFWKNGGVRAMAFNDGALLTCVSNDISFEEVFSTPIRQFADPGDIAMCISSSGGSPNIRRGAEAAMAAGCHVITLSGFQPDNPLRGMGHLNFFVPSHSYGFVETLHQYILHSILDVKMYLDDKRDVFFKNSAM